MLHGYVIYGLLSPFHLITGEKAYHLLINIFYETFVNGDARKQSHHAFGHGIDVDGIFCFITAEAVFINCFTVFDGIYLADVALVAFTLRDELMQFFFIHVSLLFVQDKDVQKETNMIKNSFQALS